jgi:uncharacterized membrane protein required for colicin V production
MIPVEYLWLTLIFYFGIFGMVRGIWRELGVTTIVLLSLFGLNFGWQLIGGTFSGMLPGGLTTAEVQAIYYSVTVLFVAFIAYEGFSLRFPIPEMKGIAKAIVGFPGGLVNGYLIMGTVWDVINQADYFQVTVPLGTSGSSVSIASTTTELHATLTSYLPVTLMNSSPLIQYAVLVAGLLLLLAIILK